MKKRKPKSSKPSPSKQPQGPTAKRRNLEIEALEPRILLSATWTGTGGDDSHNAGNSGDNVYGLDGNDTLHGGTGKDLIDGGAGDDTLYGNQGNDDLFSGGGNDYMDGQQGSDMFHFDGAQHGDAVTVVGGSGNDTIDLSGYHNNQVHESGSTLTVDLGGGHSFTINHSQVENIVTADGTYTPGAVPVNHAPTASDGSVHINEDAAASVVTLAGTDPDTGDAVDHYVVDSLPDHGTLMLNGNAVSAGDSISQADVAAGHLTFQPDANWNGDTSFGFHAHDGDALSANAGTFTLHVDPVNDAGSATNGSVNLNEDSSAVITLAGTDPDTGDAVDHYVVDSTPDHGTLLLNGNAVHAGDSISQADVAAGHLTFQPDAHWNGDTSFGFYAHDGDALSANAGTFSIHVDAVNDAPSASTGSITVGENATATISLTGSDPDAGDAVEQYRIDSLPNHGTLLLNGNAVNAGDVISQADISAGHLTFQPDAGWNGSTSLNFSAHDGDAWSASAESFDINVSSVNDAPVTGAGSLTLNEDAGASAITLSGTDPDTGDAVTQYRIESLPANGTLMLNGSAVSANDVVTQAQIDGGQLTFQPNADWNGATSFSYRAHDGDVFADNAGTFNITVNAANDGPAAADGSLTLNEDAAASVVTLSGTDPDTGDAVDHYVIDSTPDHGTLLLNGNAVHAGDSVSQADIDAGHLTFAPDADWHGDTSFGFHSHDGDALSANAGTFSIHVDAVNDAASVNAGADVSADEGSTVNLSAAASDQDGDGLTYSWTQTGGPGVTLASANGSTPSFVAPDVDSPTTLTFEVQVSDGHVVTTDTVSVLVNPVAAASGGGGGAVLEPPPVVTPPVEAPHQDPVAEGPSDPPPTDPHEGPVAEVPGDHALSDPVDEAPAEPPPVSAPPVDAAPPLDGGVSMPPVVDVPAVTPDVPTINVITPPVGPAPTHNVVDVGAPIIGAGPQPVAPTVPNVPTDGTPDVNTPAPLGPADPAPIGNHGEGPTPNHDGLEANGTTASADSADDRVTWDGHEDMQVMDPRAEFADALDNGSAFDGDSSDATIDPAPVPFSNAIESQFSVTQVVTLPTFALTGSAAAGMVPTLPGTGRGSMDDIFIADGDTGTARRWAARYSDDHASLSNSWFDDQHDEAKSSPDDSGVYAQAKSDGFFARLWGAVRGLGASGSRGASDERENKRA